MNEKKKKSGTKKKSYGHLRDAGIQERTSDKGRKFFVVRWLEDIEGKTEPRSKSFPTIEIAEKFRAECRLKLGIVHVAKSMMHDQLRPAADLQQAFAEFVEEKRQICSPRSANYKHTAYYLSLCIKIFGWAKTTDIPADAMKTIAVGLASKGSFTVRKTQERLRLFIRSRMKRYAFEDGILEDKMSRHKKKDYYIFLDEEKDLILQELTSPLRYPDGYELMTKRKQRAVQISSRGAFYVRRALFPVIWIQLLWGLRPLETVLLRVEHWNPRSNELTITGDITKTKQQRSFVVDQVTASMLNCLTKDRPHDDRVFLSAYGRPWLDTSQMSIQFRRVLRSLHIQGSLYSCRHYAITTLCELMPGQLRSVMAISGHDRLESMDHYLGLKGNRKLPAAGAYDKIYEQVLNRTKPEKVSVPFQAPSNESPPHPPQDPLQPQSTSPSNKPFKTRFIFEDKGE